MKDVEFGGTVPVLRIFDEAKAKEFYLDFLQYEMDWAYGGEELPVYMQVTNGSCTLHLSEHHGDACPGASVRIPVSDIEVWHRLLIGKEYKYMKPGIEETPWNTREVKVTDPFGNRLIYYSPVS
ncbi:VOC family protein [Rossellomorea vietnamensis]|uniref:Bleomycin resistance protein n=1 Tax=Rossellomorea vietnamensis TaxID=218284 RepID=A0A5D4KBI5_9BACI|nr:glyoxalase superfamily protein [Rossellomorea vietnamensis]TYR74678.1 VOC family protein [Rossellomorea vietnamensis]